MLDQLDRQAGARGLTGELGDCPNRQGYLILGHCTLHPTPVPEPCQATTADCSFGIVHCRCIRPVGAFLLSTPATLTPRDKRRIQVKTICSL